MSIMDVLVINKLDDVFRMVSRCKIKKHILKTFMTGENQMLLLVGGLGGGGN